MNSKASISLSSSSMLQTEKTFSYLWESLEKANAWTPAECPFRSNARATSLNSPPFPKQTSQTFTSGVKPQEATNLKRRHDPWEILKYRSEYCCVWNVFLFFFNDTTNPPMEGRQPFKKLHKLYLTTVWPATRGHGSIWIGHLVGVDGGQQLSFQVPDQDGGICRGAHYELTCREETKSVFLTCKKN